MLTKGDKIFLAICIVILIVLISISVACVFNPKIVPWYPYGKETDHYDNLSVAELKGMIANNKTMTILDVRALEGCGTCQFKSGHLPGAILTDDATKYFNATYDILVYSKDGTVGEDFCNKLKYNVYGKIYNLEGGWEAWVAYDDSSEYEHNEDVEPDNSTLGDWSPPWEFIYGED